ncbi:hypothetical protein ACVWWG_008969 [Bradyrhizobium sp. LB7.2]
MIKQALGVLAVLIAFLAWYFISGRRKEQDGEWHAIGPATYKYRRYVNGKWQYRDMTPEEERQHQLNNAL